MVAECGRVGRRSRLLSARVVVYFVPAMCLFSGQGYEEAALLLTQGLKEIRWWDRLWWVPTTTTAGRTRRRPGPELLTMSFGHVWAPGIRGHSLCLVSAVAAGRGGRPCPRSPEISWHVVVPAMLSLSCCRPAGLHDK
ncbi:transposase domain-containing protein [Streptomyces sp. NPDC000405]|uniref:transposase domain-containing protein n=1 Tax=Streptomyces sp. NPDC000405 TaxID=3161033 RepID=UPI00398CEC4F